MAKPSILAAGFLAVFTTATLAAAPNAQAQLLIYELNRAGNDKGCGNKDKATGQLGADVLTDVVVKN